MIGDGVWRGQFASLPEPDMPLTAPRSIQSADPVQGGPWLADIERQIRSFSELPRDWDSYGGGAVPQGIVEAAVGVAAIMSALGLSRPDACPESSGGVLLQQGPSAPRRVDLRGLPTAPSAN